MTDLKWWQKAVFYQIYPRSFEDSNRDGIGDLAGIISRLDYLKDLGIDAIWLSPHYPSPLFDCGYDIADYTGVAPEYGTLDHFKLLLEEAHRRDIRIILDLVLNHTAENHPWFVESRSSRTNPKRDWYIWRDGINGGPPNNWYSTFGGPAWEYDPVTEQYYYHFFFKQQPDLNWRNPQVRQAMWQAVRFWLDLGVDGYRLDATGTIFEHPDLPDQTVPITLAELRKAIDMHPDAEDSPELTQHWKEMFKYQVDQPGLHELMKELRAVVDEYDDRVMVAEADLILYHGTGNDEMNMVFNFPLMRMFPLTPAKIRQNQEERLSELAAISPDAWPCNTLGNHDTPRIYTSGGTGQNHAAMARVSLALMLTLKGTPFLYNGEEIGMTDLLLADIRQFRDLLGVWLYEAQIQELGLAPEESLERAARFTRDKNRTPMQWLNLPNGGFCPASVDPWLPVNPDYARGVNVVDQMADPHSLLSFYRAFLRVRRQTPALIAGSYMPLNAAQHQPGEVLAFLRSIPEQTVVVALNYSESPQMLDFSDTGAARLKVIFSSRSRPPEIDPQAVELGPYETLVAQV